MSVGYPGYDPATDPANQNPNPNLGGAPPAPPASDPIQTGIDDYADYLTGEGGLLERFGDIEAKLKSQSEGIDPAFDTLKAGQFAILGGEEMGKVNAAEKMFARGGMGNSTAALNATNRVRGEYGAKRMALGGQIDVMGLDRRDAALQGYGNILSTMAEIRGMPVGFDIAAEAARNAGKGGDSGGGGKSCMILCLVLTDLLAVRGDLTGEQYLAHARVSRLKSNPQLYAGYRRWADPLADACQTRPKLYAGVRRLVRAYVLDAIGERPSRLGKAIGWAMRTLSAALAPQAMPQATPQPGG